MTKTELLTSLTELSPLFQSVGEPHKFLAVHGNLPNISMSVDYAVEIQSTIIPVDDAVKSLVKVVLERILAQPVTAVTPETLPVCINIASNDIARHTRRSPGNTIITNSAGLKILEESFAQVGMNITASTKEQSSILRHVGQTPICQIYELMVNPELLGDTNPKSIVCRDSVSASSIASNSAHKVVDNGGYLEIRNVGETVEYALLENSTGTPKFDHYYEVIELV